MFVSDALTGSGVLGASWNPTGTWERTASGARQTASTGQYRKAEWVGAPLEGVNYRVAATVAYDSDAAIGAGIACRWATGATVSGYVLIRFANKVYRVELSAGAEISAPLVATPGTGSVALEMIANGDRITSIVNGTVVDTLTDSTYATGAPGLVAYGGGSSEVNYLTAWSALDLFEIAMRRRRGYTLY